MPATGSARRRISTRLINRVGVPQAYQRGVLSVRKVGRYKACRSKAYRYSIGILVRGLSARRAGQCEACRFGVVVRCQRRVHISRERSST
jgi:hypothetical protein